MDIKRSNSYTISLTECNCSPIGTMIDSTCDGDGICDCRDGYTGDKCDQCESGYFSEDGESCSGIPFTIYLIIHLVLEMFHFCRLWLWITWLYE